MEGSLEPLGIFSWVDRTPLRLLSNRCIGWRSSLLLWSPSIIGRMDTLLEVRLLVPFLHRQFRPQFSLPISDAIPPSSSSSSLCLWGVPSSVWLAGPIVWAFVSFWGRPVDAFLVHPISCWPVSLVECEILMRPLVSPSHAVLPSVGDRWRYLLKGPHVSRSIGFLWFSHLQAFHVVGVRYVVQSRVPPQFGQPWKPY